MTYRVILCGSRVRTMLREAAASFPDMPHAGVSTNPMYHRGDQLVAREWADVLEKAVSYQPRERWEEFATRGESFFVHFDPHQHEFVPNSRSVSVRRSQGPRGSGFRAELPPPVAARRASRATGIPFPRRGGLPIPPVAPSVTGIPPPSPSLVSLPLAGAPSSVTGPYPVRPDDAVFDDAVLRQSGLYAALFDGLPIRRGGWSLSSLLAEANRRVESAQRDRQEAERNVTWYRGEADRLEADVQRLRTDRDRLREQVEGRAVTPHKAAPSPVYRQSGSVYGSRLPTAQPARSSDPYARPSDPYARRPDPYARDAGRDDGVGASTQPYATGYAAPNSGGVYDSRRRSDPYAPESSADPYRPFDPYR